jgi:hypothetical protein
VTAREHESGQSRGQAVSMMDAGPPSEDSEAMNSRILRLR